MAGDEEVGAVEAAVAACATRAQCCHGDRFRCDLEGRGYGVGRALLHLYNVWVRFTAPTTAYRLVAGEYEMIFDGVDHAGVRTEEMRSLGGRIAESYVRMRVDEYLARFYPFFTQEGWRQRCDQGRVYVHGQIVGSDYRLQLGDRIFHHYPVVSEPEVNRGVFCFRRVWDIRGFYKPPHLPMHEGGAYRYHTFAHVVRGGWGEDYRAVHRLDRETSGVVLCSSFARTRGRLSQAWRQRRIRKVYYGIVRGRPVASAWTVDAPIGWSRKTLWREKRWVDDDGAEASTHFEVLESSGHYTLVKIVPQHGRTHQIRIHAAYCGHPLVGDTRYQEDERVFLDYVDHGYRPTVLEKIMAPRLCLHAATLEVPAEVPVSRVLAAPPPPQTLTFHLPLPADMQWIWQQLCSHPQRFITEIPHHLHEEYAQQYQRR